MVPAKEGDCNLVAWHVRRFEVPNNFPILDIGIPKRMHEFNLYLITTKNHPPTACLNLIINQASEKAENKPNHPANQFKCISHSHHSHCHSCVSNAVRVLPSTNMRQCSFKLFNQITFLKKVEATKRIYSMRSNWKFVLISNCQMGFQRLATVVPTRKQLLVLICSWQWQISDMPLLTFRMKWNLHHSMVPFLYLGPSQRYSKSSQNYEAEKQEAHFNPSLGDNKSSPIWITCPQKLVESNKKTPCLLHNSHHERNRLV